MTGICNRKTAHHSHYIIIHLHSSTRIKCFLYLIHLRMQNFISANEKKRTTETKRKIKKNTLEAYTNEYQTAINFSSFI